MDRLLIMKFGGRTSELTRQFLAEFMGTFILLVSLVICCDCFVLISIVVSISKSLSFNAM